MPKNAYFLEKRRKFAAASGDPPPNPYWSSAAGKSALSVVTQRVTDIDLSKCISSVKPIL